MPTRRRGISSVPTLTAVPTGPGKPVSTGADRGMLAKPHATASARPGSEANLPSQAQPARALVGASRRFEAPVVVETMGLDGQALRVAPAVFLALVERLDRPVIAHRKRRFGAHCYFVPYGNFIVETRTSEKLPLSRDRGPLAAEALAAAPSLRPRVEGDNKRGERKHLLGEFYTPERWYVTEWWNTPRDPALSVARLRIEPGIRSRPYRLRGITERYLFLAGHGVVDIDGERQEVGPGDGVLIRGGSWRYVVNTGDRDLGLLAICRPRFQRLSQGSVERRG